MPAEPKGPSPTPSSIDAAERRQLTVMFCDLVGSTAVSARLDPEDMREIIRAYQDACSGAVARYEASSPSSWATECSPISAFPAHMRTTPSARCGPARHLAAVVAKLETPANETLQVRIGIATGIVVVGELSGRARRKNRPS